MHSRHPSRLVQSLLAVEVAQLLGFRRGFLDLFQGCILGDLGRHIRRRQSRVGAVVQVVTVTVLQKLKPGQGTCQSASVSAGAKTEGNHVSVSEHFQHEQGCGARQSASIYIFLVVL